MLLTEAEAMTKWCPFARVLALEDRGPTPQVGGGYNRFDGEPPASIPRNGSANCIGSACMAWRWAGYLLASSTTVPNQDEAHGYCGLAGRAVVVGRP